MSLTYREYHLSGGYQDEGLEMPVGAEIKRIDRSPEGRIRLVAMIDSKELKRETRLFKCVSTGTPLPSTPGLKLVYLGTVTLPPTTWHVHEWTKDPVAKRELESEPAPEPKAEKPNDEPVEPPAPAAEDAPVTPAKPGTPKKNPFAQR